MVNRLCALGLNSACSLLWSERDGANLASDILTHYCKLTLKQLAVVDSRDHPSTIESQSIWQQLSQLNIGDDSRFRIAQQYILDEPHQPYSRSLRRQVCDNCNFLLQRPAAETAPAPNLSTEE